jgi:hypothetical protein
MKDKVCFRCKQPCDDDSLLCDPCKIYMSREEPDSDEYDILQRYFIEQMSELGDKERLTLMLKAITYLKEQKRILESLR